MMPPAIPRLQKLEELARYAFTAVCNTVENPAIPETERPVSKSFLCRVTAARSILLATPIYHLGDGRALTLWTAAKLPARPARYTSDPVHVRRRAFAPRFFQTSTHNDALTLRYVRTPSGWSKGLPPRAVE
jgi:hypothetical protein